VYTTQIVDLDRHRLLDVIEGRSRDVLGRWLSEQGDDWCDRIWLATLDPAAGYRNALEDHLPNATLVVDHFHAVRLANKAIDDVRRRVQQHTLGHRGRKADPLYRARRVLLTGYERLDEGRFEWMASLLRAGDPDGEVSAAWIAKELLRDVYSAVDETHARRRMIAFYIYCADAEVPELARLARTMSRWSEEIFAYHRTGHASNGRVENTHMLAEKTRRNAHGFTNLDNYRRRLIGRLGIKWHTQATARIRGRQPRFIHRVEPAIMGLAERHGIAVIEDASQAHGATVAGRPVGSFGTVAAFSCCQDKIITTGGEGGVITTADEDLLETMWSLRDHGRDRAAAMSKDHPPGYRWVYHSFGTNARMTEFQSALGSVQLHRLDDWLAARRTNAGILNRAAAGLPALRSTIPPDGIGHAYYKHYLFVRPERLKPGWDRDRVMLAIEAEGIPCHTGSCPELYLEQAFPPELRPAERLPVAKELGETSLMFMVHPTMEAADMADTAAAISKVMTQATA